MKALYKDQNGVRCCVIDTPIATEPDDIVIRVKAAGLCRTDIYVAQGLVKAKDALVLGHEFAGVIEQTGADVTHLAPGDRVTVMPVMPCGTCGFCQTGQQKKCPKTSMLGIHYDGAFAEYIKVPASCVYKLPDNVPFKLGAYSEPVAASLSVLKAGIQPHETGLIYGDNRFGQLIYRILKARGFENIDVHSLESGQDLPENHYDFAIETLATQKVMDDIFYTLKPQGRAVLKSRKHDPVGINFNQAVMKEITLSAVNYGDFDDVLALLASKNFNVDDLLGDSYALEEYETVFDLASQSESRKIFFEMD